MDEAPPQRRATVAPEVPRSQDAECAILCCLLNDPERLMPEAAVTLPVDAFYFHAHRLIYSELQALHEAGKPIDLVLLSQHLTDRGLLEKAGGAGYLAEITNFVPTTAQFHAMRTILLDKLTLRRVIDYATGLIQEAYSYQERPSDLLDRLESQAMTIRANDGVHIRSDDFREQLDSTLNSIQEQMRCGAELSGYSTGFEWVDQMTGGIRSEYWVIAARTSVGKTSLVLNLAEELALVQNLPIGIFSLEMSSDALIRRMLSGHGYIPARCLQNGKIDKEMQVKLLKSYEAYRRTFIRLDDTSGLTIRHIRAKARRWKQQYGIRVLIIDYLQRISGTGGSRQTQLDEYAEISGGLADLRKELDLPILVLAQLNRKCEIEKRKPRSSDVEGCGNIEQDCDTLLILSNYTDVKPDNPSSESLILFDITKQRNGARDSQVHLFRGPFTQFERTPFDVETARLKNNLTKKKKGEK